MAKEQVARFPVRLPPQRKTLESSSNRQVAAELARQIYVHGDYEGRFPLPMYPLLKHLATDEIVPTVVLLMNGDIIHWSSENSVLETKNQVTNPNSQFEMAIKTMLDSPSEESAEGFRIWREDIEHHAPDRSLLEPDKLQEFWLKFLLSIKAHAYVKLRSLLDHGEMNLETERFFKAVEAQIPQLGQMLQHLGLEDLHAYIQFENLRNQTQNTKVQYIPKLDFAPQLIQKKVAETNQYQDTLIKNFTAEIERAWNRLKTGWGWKQVQEVISLLPSLTDVHTFAYTVAALEENLLNLPQEKLKDQELPEIDPAGVYTLLSNRWTIEHKDMPMENYPILEKELGKNIEFPDFSVPKKHLPSTTITLLTKVVQANHDRTKFENLLSNIQDLVLRYPFPLTTTNWLLTLLVIKHENNAIGDFIQNNIFLNLGVDEAVRQTLLNQRPGKLWLTQDGRIRVTEAKTHLASAFPIFTSSAEPDNETAPQKLPPTPKDEKPKLVIEAVQSLPFLGEVGQVANNQVPTLLTDLFHDNRAKTNEYELLEEFDHLQHAWKRQGSHNESLLYIADLNSGDQKIHEAQKLGISAIFFQEKDVYFVLSKNVTNGHTPDGTEQIALRGELDQAGTLHVNGMPDSFIGEPDHLILNNIVLKLSTQRLRPNLETHSDKTKTATHELNSALSNWNRNTKSYPKIGTEGIQFIAVRIPSFDDPILVGTAPK